MKRNKNNIKYIKRINFMKMCLVALIASILNIILTTTVGFVDFDIANLHLIFRLFIWLTTFFISYTLAYLIGKLFKTKFNYLNHIVLSISCLFSVVWVILISGSFEYDYVITFTSIVAIIELWHNIKTKYNSNKDFYNS